MGEQLALDQLARHLYRFLPASGNSATSFPLAAAAARVGDGWPEGKASKLPAVLHLLTWTYSRRRDRFGDLMIAIVRQSLTYRSNKSDPLTREEVEQLNRLLVPLGLRVSELRDVDFLNALHRSLETQKEALPARSTDASDTTVISEAKYTELTKTLLEISALSPIPRGFAFERFLVEVFDVWRLAPRGSFRLVGEQIDGSFLLHHETFLLEAKWQNAQIGAADLRSFSAKVSDKAAWSRGLFISNSGFSSEGLEAFGRGKPVILMDGLDLFETLQRRMNLMTVLATKVRRAAETGRPFVPVREL